MEISKRASAVIWCLVAVLWLWISAIIFVIMHWLLPHAPVLVLFPCSCVMMYALVSAIGKTIDWKRANKK